jgi:hypothetical protein
MVPWALICKGEGNNEKQSFAGARRLLETNHLGNKSLVPGNTTQRLERRIHYSGEGLRVCCVLSRVDSQADGPVFAQMASNRHNATWIPLQ